MRGAQDLVHRMFAPSAVLEHYLRGVPRKGRDPHWLLRPKRCHALLTELGGIAQPASDANGALRWNEDDVSRLVQAALELAKARLLTKAGVATMRDLRRRIRARARSESLQRH